MKNSTLTLFYDGQCPLCIRKMSQLKKLDKHGRLIFEDILAPDFKARFPNLSIQRANRVMHALRSDGVMLEALDAVHAAWSLVGCGWRTAPLRWPVVRWFADKAYLLLAKHRYKLSKVLTGKARCERCSID